MAGLLLCYRGEPLREFPLGPRTIEVGRGPSCDIVVHDPEVADRQLLLERAEGSVVAYDLTAGRPGRPRSLRPGEPVHLGRHHSLVCVPSLHGGGASRTTDLLEPPGVAEPSLSLLVGWGRSVRRVGIGRRPLSIGSSASNDVVLADRAVSRHHCRIVRDRGGALVRDTGSRNGTWVDGLRITEAHASSGSRIRVGRTDLRIVPVGVEVEGRRLVAQSSAMMAVLGAVDRYARLPWPVLLQGESGSGKEGLARALHDRGPRAAGPFVAINAGGLPRELLESELFGHERGAFTGAVGVHRGVFEQAHGGTLFLDEVAELPLPAQARLLRVLEDGQVRRVGGEDSHAVDVRVVCASHRDLQRMGVEGTFRRDLYFRLGRLVVQVPPLRERPEDIAALSLRFLEESEVELGPRQLADDALTRLLVHPWPGNVRELRNVVTAAAAASPSRTLGREEIERALERVSGVAPEQLPLDSLQAVLSRYRGNISATARALGIPRTTLRDRLRGLRKAGPDADQRIKKPA